MMRLSKGVVVNCHIPIALYCQERARRSLWSLCVSANAQPKNLAFSCPVKAAEMIGATSAYSSDCCWFCPAEYVAMKCHADKLLMASIRKQTNCDDFHSLAASVHMSIRMPPLRSSKTANYFD